MKKHTNLVPNPRWMVKIPPALEPGVESSQVAPDYLLWHMRSLAHTKEKKATISYSNWVCAASVACVWPGEGIADLT